MALLEEPNVCAICERPVSGYVDGVPVYFCPHCFTTYKEEILAMAAWVKWLRLSESARRKRRNGVLKTVGLPQFTDMYQGIEL